MDVRGVDVADLLQHVCYAMAGANAFAAALFLFLYRRRGVAASELFPFALLCLGIAGYDVFAAGLYGSRSVAEGSPWQRLQILSFGPINVAMLWFMGIAAQGGLAKPRFDRLLLGFMGVFCVLTAAFASFGGAFSAQPLVKTITWGGRPLITYYEMAYAPALAAGQALFYAGFLYAATLLFRAYRRTGSGHTLAILGALATYVASLAVDTLVGSGRLDFVYTSEYAYLALVVVMSAALIERFVRLHAEVEALNAALARRVEAAEAEIDALQDLIPICSHCKKIRRDDGFWQQVDQYFAERHEAAFTHGICPTCIEQHFPDVAERRRRRASLEPVPGEGRPPGSGA